MRKGKPHHRDFVPEAAPLVQAAAEGDLPRARSLVKAGIPVSAFSNKSWGYYPIHVAAEKGHDKVVGFLLSSGANAETRTAAEFEQASDTPLLLACMNRHLKVVKVLVEAGADINGRDWLKNTPLGNAIKNDDAKLIAYLLEKGAKAEQVHLRLATGKGNLALMDLLVERGLRLDQPIGQPSLLNIAISRNRIDVVEWLAKRGVDVNQVSGDFSEPPLVQSCRMRKWDIANILLQNGADPNLGSKHLAFPLNYSVRCAGLSTAELLINKGARLDTVDFEKMTPIDWAIEDKNKAMFDLLIKSGANVPKKTLAAATRLFGRSAATS